MAVQIPIISDFDGKGIKQAVQQFKELEGTGKKAQFALKKAAIPAAAALAGVSAALFDATKGAIEDAAESDKLAKQLKRVTVNTDAQIAANEEWIASQGKLRAFTDSQLRPTIAKLATATGSLEMAQEGATLAMDIATATGKSLDSVTTALAKAYGGNTAALAKLDPGLRDIIKSGIDTTEVFSILNSEFGGAAKDAANTAEGGFKRLKISLDETKESVGAALLPIIEKALPVLQKFADWAQKHPQTFTIMAAAIGGVAAAILAVNTAMALNPFSAIAAGVALLVVGLVAAYKKFEWFRTGVNAVINGIVATFEFMVNAWVSTVNTIIRAVNLIKPGKDIATLAHVTFGRVGGDSADAGAGSGVPKMATGGVVTSPTLALIGEAGPEAVVPLNKAGAMGNNITVHVNGGDPNAIVDALRRYMRQSGALPLSVY